MQIGSLGSAPFGQHVLNGSLLIQDNISEFAISINARGCWSSCWMWPFGPEAWTHDIMVIEIREMGSNCFKNIV